MTNNWQWSRSFALLSVLIVGAAAAQEKPVRTTTKRPADSLNRMREKWLEVGKTLQQKEAVQMFVGMARGSGMGPGGGWFHPAESRYDWSWLAKRHSVPTNKSVAASDFRGTKDWFTRLDRDRSGDLSADDFDWSDKSEFLRSAQASQQVARRIDANSNGRVTKAEWSKFFEAVSNGKDYLTPEDLVKAMIPPKTKDKGPSIYVLIKGLLNQELGSFKEGPKIGEPAPDFFLRTHDGNATVALSSYRDKMPVVLVFGSFT